MAIIHSQPAASANYMALILGKKGAKVKDIKAFRAQIVHIEPTLSYAIAWAGYQQTHKLLHSLLIAIWHRLKAREQQLVYAVKPVRGVRKLKDDVERFQELLDAACASVNDLKKNDLQFEWDIHMSVVDMVRVRWELEDCDF